MSLSIFIPLAVAVVGLGLYLAGPPKWQEVGRIMFLCGLFVAVLVLGQGHVRISAP